MSVGQAGSASAGSAQGEPLHSRRLAGEKRAYLCIDLKTFYASVECADRGLDPFTTNLVVADVDRTEKTICLAVTPAMKKLGVRNRCRLFEIPKDIRYIAAKPRMRRYMEVSAQIYGIYLRYVSPEDIHVYSIDECFIDAAPYRALYGLTARQLAEKLMGDVLAETSVRATAGIGENLFLAKVALDITAKHAPDGIGSLTREEFLQTVAHHRPITDIWQIGPGIARRLEKYGVRDLAGVAALRPEILYREFGVNAEYLIDHAHGVEPCTIAEIHAYVPESSSTVNGQVLPCDYAEEDARTVLKEMVDASALELVEKGLTCNHISLYVGYARERGGAPPEEAEGHRPPWPSGSAAAGDGPLRHDADTRGELVVGEHGTRRVRAHMPHANGSRKLPEHTNSYRKLLGHFERLWHEVVDPSRRIKRINVGFENLLPEGFGEASLFTEPEKDGRERKLQEAVIAVKGKYGKNALIRGLSLTDKATARERNEQVGGHHG